MPAVNHVRLFYWVAYAPMDRPGGPWWYRDFSEHYDCRAPFDHMLQYLYDLKPFLKAYYFMSSPYQLPVLDPMHVEPPRNREGDIVWMDYSGGKGTPWERR